MTLHQPSDRQGASSAPGLPGRGRPQSTTVPTPSFRLTPTEARPGERISDSGMCASERERAWAVATRSTDCFARFAPVADDDRLLAAALWVYRGFAFDDARCDSGPLSSRPAQFNAPAGQVQRARETDSARSTDRFGALRDIVRSFRGFAPPTQVSRFAHAHRARLSGVAWQIGNQAAGRMPGLDDLLTRRRRRGSAPPPAPGGCPRVPARPPRPGRLDRDGAGHRLGRVRTHRRRRQQGQCRPYRLAAAGRGRPGRAVGLAPAPVVPATRLSAAVPPVNRLPDHGERAAAPRPSKDHRSGRDLRPDPGRPSRRPGTPSAPPRGGAGGAGGGAGRAGAGGPGRRGARGGCAGAGAPPRDPVLTRPPEPGYSAQS
ncbi:terpene synthase family protein, partial [Streptomyces tendae]